MSKMSTEFDKGFQDQLLNGTKAYAVDVINGVTHVTARPIFEVVKNMNTLNGNPLNYIVNENPPLESNNRWTQLDWNVAREYQYPPMSERSAQMFHEALQRELERVQFDNNITVRTKSRRKKAHTDPSIVINEETGERFKWIDGKLVNLDEQDSTN